MIVGETCEATLEWHFVRCPQWIPVCPFILSELLFLSCFGNFTEIVFVNSAVPQFPV